MIQFAGFKKTYGHLPIITVPDITLSSGIYWIKGANGSGKSTLLKSMAGMIHCHGDVLVDCNLSLKKNPVSYRKKVNFAEAEPLFPGFLTGFELINMFVLAKNGSEAQKNYLIDCFKTRHYLSNTIDSYSSGMLKKLSLILAFFGRPKVIMLDEPLITLDAEAVETLYHIIQKEYQLNSVTFLLTSHQSLGLKFKSPVKELIVEERTLKFSGIDA